MSSLESMQSDAHPRFASVDFPAPLGPTIKISF
jgi:hypothetical protein